MAERAGARPSLPIALASAVLACAALLVGQDPTGFSVANAAPLARSETVLVSIPCAAGEWQAATDRVRVLAVGENEAPAVGAVPANAEVAPARVLMTWPDGSPSLLQVAARVSVPGSALAHFAVAPADGGAAVDDVGAVDLAPGGVPWTDGLTSIVTDPWGRPWRAELGIDRRRGSEGILWRLGPVTAIALRGVHRRDGEALFDLRAYLVTEAGSRHAELTLVLDNARPDPPLGPLRFRSWELQTADARLRLRPRLAEENGLREPLPRPEGGYQQFLLGPDRELYLGDGTAKAVRFDLFWAEGASADERRAAIWRARWPLRPLAELGDVRRSGAFGAHGGPAPQLVEGADLSAAHLAEWRQRARFGPLSGFGDPEDAGAQGTARNGPCVLHNIVRWANPELMGPAEGMVLQHLLRPPPGREPALPEDTAAFRAGLGPKAIRAPHGFTPLDYEHFAVGLLFDWYWLTGDPVALDELRRMGRGLRPLLDAVPFATCRGEGWCLQSAALISRATGDTALLRDVVDRLRGDVWPDAVDPLGGTILPQPPHPKAFAGQEAFDAPWQMAALAHGMDAALRAPGLDAERRADLVTMLEQVAVAMGGPGWVEGVGPKYLVSELDPGRYTMEAREDPLGGAAWLQVGGMVLASERVRDLEVANRMTALAREIAQHALDGAVGEDLVRVGAVSWLQLPLDRGWRPR